MKNKLLIRIFLISFIVSVGFLINSQTIFASSKNPREIPTLFFHGFGGTVRSMDYLIDQSQADGYATRTLTIFVSKKASSVLTVLGLKMQKIPKFKFCLVIIINLIIIRQLSGSIRLF